MKIRLVMLGKTHNAALRALIDEYVKRTQRFTPAEITELRETSPAALRKLKFDSASTIVLLPSASTQASTIPPVDPSAPLISADLRDFLIEWITNGWPSRVPASAQTYPLLRAKMLAILNERMLAIEIKALGCPLRHIGRTKILLGRCEITPEGMRAP